MDITELQHIYASHPNVKGLAKQLENSSVRTFFLGGLHASASPLFFSSYLKNAPWTTIFILNDMEEAGYFYHDLIQINGEENVLFFPSSYRRAIKYGQKDAGNEILRTEVLSRIQKGDHVSIVTCPEAVAEKVVSSKELSSRTLKLEVGEHTEVDTIMDIWRTLASNGWIMCMSRDNMPCVVVLSMFSRMHPSTRIVLTSSEMRLIASVHSR